MTSRSRDAGRTTVVVLGMHRSGTSLVSSLVQALGVFGGDEDERLAGDEWNARGYFEVEAVLGLNQRLLLAGGFDLSLPPIELGWEPSAGDDGATDREAGALVDSFAARGDGQWVWKDPRFSLTLPWWRPRLGRVVPILCLRHPSAVAASLGRRDRFPVSGSVKLWEIYLRQALWSCRDLDFLPVHYEEVVRDPHAVARSVHAFLSERGVRIGPFESSVIDPLVSPELRHFSAADDAVLCERQRRLMSMAADARVDEEQLRATQAECAPHRGELLELTVKSLHDELRRRGETAEFHRQQADALRLAAEEERAQIAEEHAFLRDQLADRQRAHDALVGEHRDLQAWVADREAALTWWKERSEELEARNTESQARADGLAAELEELRRRSFLRRLFWPRARSD